MSGALVAQAINESVGTPGFQGIDAILKEYLGLIAEQAGTARVPISRTINGHSLASDVDLTNDDVGAAPAGFGLGEDPTYITDIHAIDASGFYLADSATANIPPDEPYLAIIAKKRTPNELVVEAVNVHSGCKLQKTKTNGSWNEWEWVNPPMQVGVEYRTTERFLGQPVYTMIQRIGGFTGNGTCTLGSTGYHAVVRVCATASYGGMLLKVDDSKVKTIQHSAGYVYVQVSMGSETCTDCYVQMWYTK